MQRSAGALALSSHSACSASVSQSRPTAHTRLLCECRWSAPRGDRRCALFVDNHRLALTCETRNEGRFRTRIYAQLGRAYRIKMGHTQIQNGPLGMERDQYPAAGAGRITASTPAAHRNVPRNENSRRLAASFRDIMRAADARENKMAPQRLTLGNVAPIFAARTWPIETALAGWACKTRSAPGDRQGVGGASPLR